MHNGMDFHCQSRLLINRQSYQNSASFVPKLAGKVVSWLDVQQDDVILDLGCGGNSTLTCGNWWGLMGEQMGSLMCNSHRLSRKGVGGSTVLMPVRR